MLDIICLDNQLVHCHLSRSTSCLSGYSCALIHVSAGSKPSTGAGLTDKHGGCGSLDLTLAKQGLSLTEISEKVGLTMANLSILKTGKAKAIRFSTLAAVCKVLDCQPGDILEYKADKPGAGSEADSGAFDSE